MKRLLIVSTLSIALLASCNTKSEKGDHTHQDGQSHADHAPAAKTDSSSLDSSAHGHSHDRP